MGGQANEAKTTAGRRAHGPGRAPHRNRWTRGRPDDGQPCLEPEAQRLGRVAARRVTRRPRLLKIGFAPGLAILELSRIAHEGYVCEIDHSELMVSQARRRNADGVRRGVVDLRLGSVEALPAFDPPFDTILAVNAHLSGVSRTRASSNSVGCCARLFIPLPGLCGLRS